MIEIKGRRIALIGGAGFIGHHLALRLKELGADVTIFDSLQVNNLLKFAASTDENAPFYLSMLVNRLNLLKAAGIPLIVQDARQYNELSMKLSNFAPQTVVHLAAVAHANVSNKDPYSTFDHSLRTLENSLDWARSQAEHFIYLSSSMIYGHFPGGYVTEETPCEPLGIYAALKFSAEKMILSYNQAFDLPYTIIRPSALYGERCVSRRVGQIFIEKAMSQQDISIHGDGSDRLDFTYIKDFVQGVIRAIQNEAAKGETFNLTYGEGRSLMDLANIVSQHFPACNVQYLPKDKLTPDRGTLSVDKARELIGYAPEYPLEKGFVEYIGWYKENWDKLSQGCSVLG
ncbi:dTDP-glucose 4,6-dehydratase [Pseudodesulfovibrio hydrargyri]|uniref:dTDP-glucose 4,6-dehydratase n=1 Tax=Pseudodesulfovibrio hydrargyri TaxID=2125990 RepID=A0A1J5N5G4_9BACT|nr:NAD(P)-dependent oxidoreductase [Pseudodesulfovibrio hydrargyri]OIQ50064.1 dTDP-glucose 4,6-dehydratase [Pseudodesulfovibrio hydrargyri]